jgi:hypothetical protein
MDVTTIEMPRHTARAAFEQYRQAVKNPTHPEWEKEDAELARAYKAISRCAKVINLLDVMKVAGSRHDSFPKFAIARADCPTCCCAIYRNGQTTFYGYDHFAFGSRNKPSLTTHFPDATFRAWTGGEWRYIAQTLVPIIPPALRPKHKLSGYHILWEVEEWKRVAPRDPMLLKRLGGWLYAVLAVWDLTDLERAVLGMRA